MPPQGVKQQARKLVEDLPEDITWDDLVYEVITRREVEKGLADSQTGRTTPVDDVAKEFGSSE